MEKVIHVLDKGLVRLVDSMGSDLSVVRAARVSYDAAWRAGEDQGSDQRLINYLWKNGHSTPFESVGFTFEVYAPIFVLRQWHRHRTWTFNELSGRYRELPPSFYVPDVNVIGQQSSSNKQARVIDGSAGMENIPQAIHNACEQSFRTYEYLLKSGTPRELARTVLPLATYSHMFATVDLLNLLKFCSLRIHDHAQYEIRVYAEAMIDLVRGIVPVSVNAWESSRQEQK